VRSRKFPVCRPARHQNPHPPATLESFAFERKTRSVLLFAEGEQWRAGLGFDGVFLDKREKSQPASFQRHPVMYA
jgi:hypothetical protein